MVAGRVVRRNINRLSGTSNLGSKRFLPVRAGSQSLVAGGRSRASQRIEAQLTGLPRVASGLLIASVEALRVETRPVEAMERARSMLLLCGREWSAPTTPDTWTARVAEAESSVQPQRHRSRAMCAA